MRPTFRAVMTASASGSQSRRIVFTALLVAVMAAGCSEQAPTRGQMLARADDAFAAEQYDRAEKEYREVLRMAPDDPVALRQLGMIYFLQGQLPRSYQMLSRSAELQPDIPEVQTKLGLILVSQHELAKAREAALRALDRQPGDEQALILLASTAANPGEVDEVRTLIDGLRAKDQDRAGYHLAMAMLDLQRKEERRAENELATALALDPRSSAVHLTLAGLYWRHNDLEAADRAFKTASDLSPLRSPVRIRHAQFKHATGASAEATSILEDLRRNAPDYLPPRVELMKIACEAQRSEECAARTQDILAQDPANSDALFQDSVLSIARGDAARAVRDLEYLRNIYGKNPQVRYQLAVAYVLAAKKTSDVVNHQKLMNAAESNLADAMTIEPEFDGATLLSAEIRIAKGNPSAAVELLATLTGKRPQLAQAHYALASAHLALGRTPAAVTTYRRMAELFPRDPQPPMLLGRVMVAQGRQADARTNFERSLEISPDYLPALEGLVDLDLSEGQYAKAMERVQSSIDRNPDRALPWAIRGRIQLAQRNFTSADADLSKAIALDPDLERAYLMLALLHVATNRRHEAIEGLNSFIARNATAPTLLQLGTIQQSLKNFAAARDAYERLLTLSPDSVVTLNNLAVLYSEHLGRLDVAEERARRARELAPNQPNVADTLGWILFKKGAYDEALRFIQESASRLPDDPEIQFHLGMAHYALGRDDAARTSLRRATDAKAEFAGKDDARKRLALLAIDPATADAAARAELINQLRDRPNDPAALARLAELQLRDGAADQGLGTYEKVVADNPLYAPAIRRLALLYGQRPTAEPKAVELATRARQSYPNDLEVAKLLGILNYRRGLYPQAVDLLEQAAGQRRDDPELLYYLGATYGQLKRWGACKTALERALDGDLAPALATPARRALAECAETPPL